MKLRDIVVDQAIFTSLAATKAKDVLEELLDGLVACEAIAAEQLEMLQVRLQAMHTAKLLTEDELDSLEDTIADCIEILPTADVKDRAVEQTLRMVLLSERMQVDGSLARQLRRKFARNLK